MNYTRLLTFGYLLITSCTLAMKPTSGATAAAPVVCPSPPAQAQVTLPLVPPHTEAAAGPSRSTTGTQFSDINQEDINLLIGFGLKGKDQMTAYQKQSLSNLLHKKESSGIPLTKEEESIKSKLPSPNIDPSGKFIPPPGKFDPHNYHASVNRNNVPGDNSIHTCLQAMAVGVKGVCYGTVAELSCLTQEEIQQIERDHIQRIIFHSGKTFILYAEWAKKRALALKEYLESNEATNSYLVGKLLGYPEDDIVYFYEYLGLQEGLAHAKEEAATFFANKNLKF